jgi:hypothetical protein
MKYEVSTNQYINLIVEVRSYFKSSDKTIYDGRNSLKIISYQEKELVIKSFKVPHLINRIAYSFFRDSKAKKSYKNSVQIQEFTPEAIGYVEHFKFGLLLDSYYLSENYAYDFTIREALTQENFPHKEALFQAFAKFTFSLHNYNIEHLDYSPGNILIKQKEDGYEFKIIDVNRMQFKRLSNTERLENFSKLWAKEEDLKTIIYAYAPLISMDEEEAYIIAKKASKQHKDRKNLKKRLKGKKVVD